VVALERLFAATSRGAALINRIKADPSLSGCEIRIVSNGGAEAAPPSAPPPMPPASRPAAPEPLAAPDPAVASTVPLAAPPLDQRGTRRAPRYRIMEGVEVNVDGNPATLVDLSLVGAMVISPTILRPNQRVRMTLPDPGRPIRFGAAVAWASFEMPKGGPRYRAGIEFFGADPDAIARFIETRKQ
jgi:hypothetical protein